ncbi:hypothetical protein [Chryseobacterium kwangjuense]|uniref:Carboxypeptidase-like regulatory domain-containing protein n=1 Tax=Chryseobacterium kwangjuense TaxID=267125 RepID=A0A135W1B4_9FLAO|nr:hypothetical protein [Chryseobacterium kwangjuense]KXH78721.1 hypothetical protein AU378_21555 [Chryseobacterium kwangjuense]
MMKKFRIKEPCGQLWDEMQDSADGKFCNSCRKKVWDFDQLPATEIDEILKTNDSVCIKKSLLKPALSGVFLALTLTSAISVHAQTNAKSSTENVYQKNITISGKLVSQYKMKLISGEISLVTLEKLYQAKADENGNFTLSFPEKALAEYNIIRIDYTVGGSNNEEFTDYKSSILKTNELLGKQNFEIEGKYVTIGAVVISDLQPPDYYFFDGKRIGKRKFEKIKKEHPEYKYLAFYDEVTVQKLAKRSYIDNLYLLYSQ